MQSSFVGVPLREITFEVVIDAIWRVVNDFLAAHPEVAAALEILVSEPSIVQLGSSSSEESSDNTETMSVLNLSEKESGFAAVVRFLFVFGFVCGGIYVVVQIADRVLNPKLRKYEAINTEVAAYDGGLEDACEV